MGAEGVQPAQRPPLQHLPHRLRAERHQQRARGEQGVHHRRPRRQPPRRRGSQDVRTLEQDVLFQTGRKQRKPNQRGHKRHCPHCQP